MAPPQTRSLAVLQRRFFMTLSRDLRMAEKTLFGMGKGSDWPPIDSDCVESFYQRPVAPSSCYYFLLCSVLSSSRYDSAISGQFREHSGNNFAAVSHFACNCQCVFCVFCITGWNIRRSSQLLVEFLSSDRSRHHLCCTCTVLSSCVFCCFITAMSSDYCCCWLLVEIYLDLCQLEEQ